jgi:5-methylcytosine-specific restriction endonuclease McrA
MRPAKKTISKKTNKPPKTRNAGTMTESAFWSFIRSTLRQKSRWWKPIGQAKMKARRGCVKCAPKQKYEYQCAHCKQWFKDKDVNVDHITPAGSLRSANDLAGFIERLFCEVDNLQILCNVCHNKKTQDEKSKN